MPEIQQQNRYGYQTMTSMKLFLHEYTKTIKEFAQGLRRCTNVLVVSKTAQDLQEESKDNTSSQD